MNLVMPALSRPSMMFWASGRRMGSHIDCRSSARYICRCANTKNNGITGRQSVDDPLAGQYQKPITLYPIPCPTPPMCKCCAVKYTLYTQMCKYQQHCIKLRYTGRSCWGAEASPPPQGNRSIGATHHYLDDQR